MNDKKTIFVNGCFDVLHIGHIRMLQYARSLGDYLFVAIDDDERVRSKKGIDRPYNNVYNREEMLKSIRYVDEIGIFSTDNELISLVKKTQPDIMIVGSDWQGKEIIGSEYSRELRFFGRIDGYSTTKILQHSSDR